MKRYRVHLTSGVAYTLQAETWVLRDDGGLRFTTRGETVVMLAAGRWDMIEQLAK